jgi:hypothetical protein
MARLMGQRDTTMTFRITLWIPDLDGRVGKTRASFRAHPGKSMACGI